MTWPCSFKIAAISSTVIVTDPSTTRLVGAVDKGCRRAAQEDCCRCKFVGPSKTIYNRFIRWSRMGVFNRIFAALSAEGGKPDQLMIDATHLKAHRTAASLLKKGLFPDVSDAPKAA